MKEDKVSFFAFTISTFTLYSFLHHNLLFYHPVYGMWETHLLNDLKLNVAALKPSMNAVGRQYNHNILTIHITLGNFNRSIVNG